MNYKNKLLMLLPLSVLLLSACGSKSDTEQVDEGRVDDSINEVVSEQKGNKNAEESEDSEKSEEAEKEQRKQERAERLARMKEEEEALEREEAESADGSLENPYPFNAWHDFTSYYIGELGQEEHDNPATVRVRLVDVKRGLEASTELETMKFYEPAEEGMEYAIGTFEVEVIDGQPGREIELYEEPEGYRVNGKPLPDPLIYGSIDNPFHLAAYRVDVGHKGIGRVLVMVPRNEPFYIGFPQVTAMTNAAPLFFETQK